MSEWDRERDQHEHKHMSYNQYFLFKCSFIWVELLLDDLICKYGNFVSL